MWNKSFVSIGSKLAPKMANELDVFEKHLGKRNNVLKYVQWADEQFRKSKLRWYLFNH